MSDKIEGRKRPLGDSGKTVLKKLAASGGTWRRGQKALWDSTAWTIRLLDELALHCLVAETRREVYEITPAGRKKAAVVAATTRQ